MKWLVHCKNLNLRLGLVSRFRPVLNVEAQNSAKSWVKCANYLSKVVNWLEISNKSLFSAMYT